MSAIEIRNVSKQYQKDLVAIEKLNLDINRGEVFGFLGPNGAGKSTTIKMIMDYVRPTKGKISVLGYDCQKETVKAHEKIGVLPDSYGLYRRLTGFDHIEFAIDVKGSNEDVGSILDRVGLDLADAERKVAEYSSGMRQRLALGMAITGSPDVLILDEPSKGLDPHGIRMMQDIIKEEQRKGVTVFFSSHILPQVEAVCDRVGIINRGRLVTVNTVDELRKTISSSSQIILKLEKQPIFDILDLEKINGVSNIKIDDKNVIISCTDNRAKIRVVEEVRKRDNTILDIESRKASLEDLFAEYT